MKKASPEKEPVITHGELNPTPDVAPLNENKLPGGNEEGLDGEPSPVTPPDLDPDRDPKPPKPREDGGESLVTASEISSPKESFVIPNDERADHSGRAMGVIGPREQS